MRALMRCLATLSYGPWACPYCGAPFSSDAEGYAHMVAAHPDVA